MINATAKSSKTAPQPAARNEQSDFDRYLDEGIPMSRPFTTTEALYVYRELK